MAHDLRLVGRGTAPQIPTTIKNPARVANRRAELIEAATEMFLDRGFHNTSIRDIAGACSFNVASLYMYVSSKDDILHLVAQDVMDTIVRQLGRIALDPESPERSLAMGFSGYCRIVSRFRRPIRLLYREIGFMEPKTREGVTAATTSIVDYFDGIVADGMEAGVFRDVCARLVALDIMLKSHLIALHTRDVLTMGNLEDYISSQLDLILGGLLVTPVPAVAAPHRVSRKAAPRKICKTKRKR